MLTKPQTGTERVDRRINHKARELTDALKERDAAIEVLEQKLAEQQENIATLQKELEQSIFKVSILEQSYSTQLGEARDRADAAEQTMIDQEDHIATLEISRKELKRDLADVRARLDSFGTDTASVDELLESFSISRTRPYINESAGQADAPVDAKTHKEMLPPDVMFAGKKE